MPGTQITNPRGAYGQTTSGYARTVDSFKTTAAVAAKAVVAVGTTGKTVATATTNGVAALAIGVALDAAASGDTVQVATQGVVTGVPVDGATTAGVTLIRSATTAGSLAASATPALGEAFAISLVASASNTTTVWLL